MEVSTGEKIKIFKDTDADSYIRYIKDNLHFRATIKGEYIVIGKPYKVYHTTNYGKQIKEARRAKKMTREQLAELCGVRATTVLDWEMGRRQPLDWRTVQKVLEI